LRTDVNDILQMHGWDSTVPLEETLTALDTLIRSGRVRYVGVSNWSAWHVMKALRISDRDGLPRFMCQLIYYSLQAREAEYELVPVALDQGLGILAWSPLAGALLTGKWRRGAPSPEGVQTHAEMAGSPDLRRRAGLGTIDVLVDIAEKQGCGVPQIALAYLLEEPGVASLIIGARRQTQLIEDLPAADLPDSRLADADGRGAARRARRRMAGGGPPLGRIAVNLYRASDSPLLALRSLFLASMHPRIEEVGMKKIVFALATAFVLLVPAGIASAGQNDVIREGSCGNASDWKLKVSPDDAGLEVEFEVDQNVSGDRWRVKIRQDGDLAFRGTRTTLGASGSFTVRIVENDTAGSDVFRARARNLSTDEVCVGSATF
jgi:diketogulonate reductase-like aldo/keto reductase